ncbi:hypothetical protein MLD38_038246 [Melastoma candidum]|uniref:Uncharacterized protein n=1 Tax=Melastoma candidum TaxID=119954 RepID=A0ACB9KZS9_9MYRT|nr:hypothetical protein MLD38_038246 [Melastoma candidum]
MSARQEGKGRVVCVTGASGYIASWLVKLLLHRGYSVRATVRNPEDTKKTEHLLALDGAKERLHLFKAELLDQGAFDAVINGCDGVFHTASPVAFEAVDPQADLIEPALKGTLNVLSSCAKAPSVKRVVFTSSMAAVVINGRPLTSDTTIDETWFSDPKFCEESKAWYMLSKTLAEMAAVDFARKNKIDLVMLNPGLVIGPLLQPTMNFSVGVLFDIVKGSETYPNTSFRFVNVRDVAQAHVLALENPSASGRHCLVARVIQCLDVLDILRNFYPTMTLPEKCEATQPLAASYQVPSVYHVSREKAEGLGVKFTPVEESIQDTIESFKEKGFLKL